MNHDQNLRFFQNLFDGQAKQFYGKYVQSVCDSYDEACARVRNEYISIHRQNKVRKYLQSLSVAPIMRKKACTVSEALEELREVIAKYEIQGP